MTEIELFTRKAVVMAKVGLANADPARVSVIEAAAVKALEAIMQHLSPGPMETTTVNHGEVLVTATLLFAGLLTGTGFGGKSAMGLGV